VSKNKTKIPIRFRNLFWNHLYLMDTKYWNTEKKKNVKIHYRAECTTLNAGCTRVREIAYTSTPCNSYGVQTVLTRVVWSLYENPSPCRFVANQTFLRPLQTFPEDVGNPVIVNVWRRSFGRRKTFSTKTPVPRRTEKKTQSDRTDAKICISHRRAFYKHN